MKKNINQKILQPRTLGIASAIFGVLLLFIIIRFGFSSYTRGPIEILLALFLAALALLLQVLTRRPR